MKEYLPYIVSIASSLIAAITSIIVCKMQISRGQKETKELIIAEKEKIQLDYDNKIKLLREEYALKTSSQLVSDILGKTVDSVYGAPAVKNEINKQAQQTIINKSHKNKRK